MARRGTAETDKTIQIPEIKLKSMVVGIAGTTPLLTNRFSERARKEIEDKQQHEAKGAREARNPEAEFHDAKHLLADGVYGFPSDGIKKALVAAGFRFADEKGTHLRGILNIPTAHVAIQASEPTMRSDPVRLQGMKFSIAYRPQFYPWAMDMPIVFNASMIGDRPRHVPDRAGDLAGEARSRGVDVAGARRASRLPDRGDRRGRGRVHPRAEGRRAGVPAVRGDVSERRYGEPDVPAVLGSASWSGITRSVKLVGVWIGLTPWSGSTDERLPREKS